jgi:hypothetical protein
MRINSEGGIAPINVLFTYRAVENPQNDTVMVYAQVYDPESTKYCRPASIPADIMPQSETDVDKGVLIVRKDSDGEGYCGSKNTYNHMTGNRMNSEQMAKFLNLVYDDKDADSVLRITPYEQVYRSYSKADFKNTIWAKKDITKMYNATMSITLGFEYSNDAVVDMIATGKSTLALVSVPIDRFSTKDADKIDPDNSAPVMDNNIKSGVVITATLIKAPSGNVEQRISAFDVENEMRGSIREIAEQFDQYAKQFNNAGNNYHRSSLGGAKVRFIKNGSVVASKEVRNTDSGSGIRNSLRFSHMALDFDSVSIIPIHNFKIPSGKKRAMLTNGVYQECTNSLEDISIIIQAQQSNKLSLHDSVDPLVMCKEGWTTLVNGTTDMPKKPASPTEFLKQRPKEPTQGASVEVGITQKTKW